MNEQKNRITATAHSCSCTVCPGGGATLHIKNSKQNTAGLSRPGSKSSIPTQVSGGRVQVEDKTTGLQLLKGCHESPAEARRDRSTCLVFHSSVDLERFFRAIRCFSSSLFFSALAKSKQAVVHLGTNSEHVSDSFRTKQRTHVPVLQRADVRPEATIGWGDNAFHAPLQCV